MNKDILFSREIAAGIPIEALSKIRILLGGAGNTGSHFVERAIHNFLSNIFIIDFDKEGYQEHNFCHSSILLNFAEDCGKRKAETLAERATEKLLSQGSIIGKTMDILDVGPEIIKKFDITLGFFDNTDARKHLYSISRLAGVPFLEIGISKNGGQLQLFDHAADSSCYFCSCEDNAVRQSCETSYKNDIAKGIAPSTDVFGAIMADLATQAIISYFGKSGQFESNVRYCFDINTFSLKKYVFPKKANCEGCSYSANEGIIKELKGSVENTSYAELESQIEKVCGQNFKIYLPSEFCIRDSCPVCGKEKSIFKLSRQVNYTDIICPQCLKRFDGRKITKTSDSILLDGFCPVPDSIKDYSLLKLGFGYGSHIYVSKDDGSFATFTMSDDYSKLTEKE